MSVILIDDDPFTIAMTKRVVQRTVKDAQISTFKSAGDALCYLRTGDDIAEDGTSGPGIILSDLHMPGMDGFLFLDEFAKLPPAVQSRYSVFILSSASDEKEKARLFENSSFAGFCSKPLTSDKFIHLMDRDKGTGTWYLDITYDRLYLSEETFSIFGISKEKDSCLPYYGAFFLGVIHPDDRAAWNSSWDLLMRKTVSLNFQHRIVLSNSEVRQVRQQVEQIVDMNSRRKWLRGTVQDITYETTPYLVKNPAI